MEQGTSYRLVPYGDNEQAQGTRKHRGPKRWEREQLLRLMGYVAEVSSREQAVREELAELGAAMRRLDAMLIAMAPWAAQLMPKRTYPSKTQGLDEVSEPGVPFERSRRRGSPERSFGYSE